jgi:hypothetical protein
MYVMVDELEKHCNIDDASDADVTYLTSLIDTATISVENTIEQKLSGLEDANGNIPSPLKHAILLVAANLYANREPVAFGVPQAIPYTLRYLVQPYINYTITE